MTDDSSVPRSWVADLKAFCLLSWGWVIAAAIIAVVIIFAAPSLPVRVALMFPGFRGSAPLLYLVPNASLGTVSAIVVGAFALIVLVSRLAIGPRRWWIALVLIVLDAVVMIIAVSVLLSVLGQVGRTHSLGTGFRDSAFLFPPVAIASIIILCVVLASGLFVPRRLTLGVWRAPGRRR